MLHREQGDVVDLAGDTAGRARIGRPASRTAHDGDGMRVGQKSLTARIFDEPHGRTDRDVGVGLPFG